MLQVIIAGRLVADSELRFTAGDNATAVLGFTVATDVGWGDKKHGVFIKCSMWGKRGESLNPYLVKGANVTVIGEGDLNKWESGDKSGSEITCKVQEVTLQGGKPKDEVSQSSGFRDRPATAADFQDDDIDF